MYIANQFVLFWLVKMRLNFCLLVLLVGIFYEPVPVQCQKNILFLAADDLRPNLGSYDDSNSGKYRIEIASIFFLPKKMLAIRYPKGGS